MAVTNVPSAKLSFSGQGVEPDLVDKVRELGWLHLRNYCCVDSLPTEALRLGRLLGEAISKRRGSIIEHLTPLNTSCAKPNSLSKLHGTGAFPLHTDGAHLLQPPRFVLLACLHPGSSSAPTVTSRFRDLDLSEEDARLCEAAPFLVKNGRRSFYSTVLNHSRGFVRFDQGCMSPVDHNGWQALRIMLAGLQKLEVKEVHWQSADILIIDNWHVLHGRGNSSSKPSTDRRLLRVTIQ